MAAPASTRCAPTPCRRAGCSTPPQAAGLRVMVGLPWEQHVAFLDDRRRAARSIERACATAVARLRRATRPSSATRSATRSPRRSCAGTAAAGSSGSSSGSAARSERRTRRARHLRQLPDHRVPRSCRSSTSSASTSTSRQRRASTAYLARLQNLAGDRPLRAGRDRARQPPQRRATPRPSVLDWQMRTAFRPAAAPAPSSSRGPTSGTAAVTTIEDWDFGLDRPRAAAQAGARRRAARPSPSAVPRPDVAGRADLGRRLHATTATRRCAELPGGPRRARLPATTR